VLAERLQLACGEAAQRARTVFPTPTARSTPPSGFGVSGDAAFARLSEERPRSEIPVPHVCSRSSGVSRQRASLSTCSLLPNGGKGPSALLATAAHACTGQHDLVSARARETDRQNAPSSERVGNEPALLVPLRSSRAVSA
jgi:hypothetical protein